MDEKSDFCLSCGRPLDKELNKRMRYGEAPGYCNKRCRSSREHKDKPKNRKKYGATGYIYD